MISDGGGAVVIAVPEVARNCKKRPVWILGGGEATNYPKTAATSPPAPRSSRAAPRSARRA